MDIQLEKKRGIQKKHWPYIAGGALFLIFALWLIFGDFTRSVRVNKEELTIAEVKRGKFDDFVRVDGQVHPISVVHISPEEGGIVLEKRIEEGAHVHKGDVLVVLANSNLDLEILNAESELAEKQNILRNTQISMEQDRLNNRSEQAQLDCEVARKARAFRQQERLYREKLNSREEYLQAREDYELARKKQQLIGQRLQKDSIFRLSQVDQMEDNLRNMQRNVQLIRQRKEHLKICSPIDGELGLLDVELGKNIGAGQNIGQINDLSDYKVQAAIDEHYIDRVHSGLMATMERGGKTYRLHVRKVFPEVRDGKFRVDLVFDGAHPENIRTGQTYYLNLQLGQPVDALLIPKGTFFQSTSGEWIFVLNAAGNKAYKRKISIGRQNPKYYEVLEGLEPGEKVVVSNYDAFGEKEILKLK